MYKQAMQPIIHLNLELKDLVWDFLLWKVLWISLDVVSIKGEGTKVVMTKTIELPRINRIRG